MTRQRQKTPPIPLKHVVQQRLQPVLARRPGLAVVGLPQDVFFGKPRFKGKVWKCGAQVRGGAAAVTGVNAEGFAEEFFDEGFVGS